MGQAVSEAPGVGETTFSLLAPCAYAVVYDHPLYPGCRGEFVVMPEGPEGLAGVKKVVDQAAEELIAAGYTNVSVEGRWLEPEVGVN